MATDTPKKVTPRKPRPKVAAPEAAAAPPLDRDPGFFDPGTAFVPQVAKIPAPAAVEETEAPEWTIKKTRMILRNTSAMIDGLAGEVAQADLRFNDQELDDLAPPLTNIINNRPMLRRLGEGADTIAVALALGGYAGRVMQERAENILDKLEAEGARIAAPSQAVPNEMATPVTVAAPLYVNPNA